MKRKSYTILILPRQEARFRKVQLSFAFVVALGAVAGAVILGALYTPHLFLQLQNQATSMEKLTQENDELRLEKTRFEDALAEMSDRLSAFEAHTGRLASELGVGELSVRAAAGGESPGHAPARPRSLLSQELSALQSRTDSLDESLSQLDQAFHARIRMLASTPNTMPVRGWFSHGFGWRNDPWTGEREFHRGMDIVADLGTEVRAPADGVVSLASRRSDYGKLIDLSHGYGYVTRYAHLSEILVRPGQRVHRGDVIGRVGSTGRSTGPHLHYEVFRDGRRVNPWKYLGQRGR
jgi:murein DD-endopeptidase MepM/ murein hydrolase activator NlpD